MNRCIAPNPDIHREAHALVSLGYHLVPVAYGGKRPLIAWRDSESSPDAIDEWFDRFGARLNIAIHAGKSGIVVMDADTEEAVTWIGRHCPPTQMLASTPRGGLHAYFRAGAQVCSPSQNLFGIGLDVRSRTSLIIASPSWSQEHRRRWTWKGPVLSPADLPVLPTDAIRVEPLPKPRIEDIGPAAGRCGGPIHDVTRWIMAVPSVQGSHGSNGCFKVACRLVDAGFSWEEAMHWLRAWNDRVPEPPWSDRELEHKLRSAFNR